MVSQLELVFEVTRGNATVQKSGFLLRFWPQGWELLGKPFSREALAEGLSRLLAQRPAGH